MTDGLAEPELAGLTAAAGSAGEDIKAGLALAAQLGPRLPFPGGGDTAARWRMLAAVAAGDLTAARILEPHADALAILAEAGESAADGCWGVFAAEAPGNKLKAEAERGGWRLSGTKPWCSLGTVLDRALVTAHGPDGVALFAVDLRQPSVTGEVAGWVSRGLRAVTSGPLHFDAVPAEPVGAAGWYLTRPGFAWGGIGVAACWYGAAWALADTLRQSLATRAPDPIRDLNLGRADVGLHAASRCLTGAAADVDAGCALGAIGALLAVRVRSVVAAAAELAVEQVGHALGPAPLAFDEPHARRVADLLVYLRQHHAERDLADVGARLRELPSHGMPPW
ncbi:MAG: acyl-CoA dehydrogenase [Actinomycetota bacterium]